MRENSLLDIYENFRVRCKFEKLRFGEHVNEETDLTERVLLKDMLDENQITLF